MDEEWMTAVLRDGGVIGSGDRVTGLEAQRMAMETGFSSELYRLWLTGDEPVPRSVVVKVPTATVVREAMDLVGGYAREVAFYEHVAGRAPLSTPAVYLARIADDSTDFVLVLEDLGGWENADHLEGLSFERARQCVGQLAGLHAWSTRDDVAEIVEAFPRLDSPVTRQIFPVLFAEGWGVYREQARAPIPAAVSTFADGFGEHAVRALAALTERRMLVHGDIRADNMIFRDGRLAIVDFQLACRAVGAVDVGYLVSQGLTSEERDGRDEQLLRHYLERLADCGVRDYGFDEAWRHYRFAVAFFLLFPVSALRGWDLLPDRSRELCLRLIERSIAAIEDIDALAVFS
jgi:aminoglycoside phosphotransferase (APT) family kinase protein